MTEKVIIDSREPPEIYNMAKKILKDFKVVKEKLEIGDFQYNGIIIERKSISDLINSIKRPNFWSNIYIMKSNFEFPILYIEGDEYEKSYSFNMRQRAFQSVESSMAALYLMRIPIVQFSKASSAFRFFDTLFKKSISTKKSPLAANLNLKKTKASLKQLRIANITTVPKIGKQTSDNLLKEHGSLISVIEDSKKQDNQNRKKIYDFYYGEYNE